MAAARRPLAPVTTRARDPVRVTRAHAEETCWRCASGRAESSGTVVWGVWAVPDAAPAVWCVRTRTTAPAGARVALISATPPHACRRATATRGQLRRMSGPADVDAAAHAAFLADRAQVTPCRHLPALLSLLRLQGLEVVAPSAERRAMHPHVVPLARDPASGQVTSLLRLPFASKGDMLPLVRSDGATGLTLVAPGAQQYLHRCGVEADEAGDGALRDATLACVNASGQVYQKGDIAKHTPKLPLEKYLAVKVGVFPDVYEAIANSHMDRGDATAALIAAERSTKLQTGWGRPHLFQSRLYRVFGREQESRDSARLALMMPLWSLGDVDLHEVAQEAGTTDIEAWQAKILELSHSAREVEIQQGTRTEEEAALERAEHLMNGVCLGTYQSWVSTMLCVL